MGLIRLEPAALKQAARDLDLAQARLDSVDRLICEILSVSEEIPADRVDMKRFQRPEGYWTKQEELP